MTLVPMSDFGKRFFICFTLVVSLPVMATELSHTQFQRTGQEASSIESNTLSATDLARAQLWALSEREWRRYKQLMQGIRGSISPSTISPIEVLGIHARDETERQRYAERWAQAMREDVARILAFQHAYDAAGKRLYPNEPLIDINRLPVKDKTASQFQTSDRLLFFVRPTCSVCDQLMSKLLKRINEVSGIDIYLMDVTPGDDVAVRNWAARQMIDPDWVRSRRVTLNHDGGAMDRLTRGQGRVPYILRRRGEFLSQISSADL